MFHKVILHIKTEVYYKYSVVLAYILEKTLATPTNTSSLYVRYLPISLGLPATFFGNAVMSSFYLAYMVDAKMVK